MPWPVGLVLGIVAFLGIRYGIGAFLSSASTGMFRQLGPALSKSLAPLSWIALLACWGAAVVSFFKAQHRKRLLETQTGLGSIAAMDWRDFERLVGEAFRRRGYRVEETGLGGADGGIDLILRKDGRSELVQCKQWRSRQVKASVVREMWGLVAHHKANGVKIVCVGAFTHDARQFAEGKAIELITGERLLEMITEAQSAGATSRGYEPAAVQAAPRPRPAPTAPPIRAAQPVRAPSPARAAPPAATSPTTQSAPLIQPAPPCPRCGGVMVRRTNKATHAAFWGCSKFPRCRGTVELGAN